MGDMFCIRVVYHNRPDKVMRALNYYSSKPKILGQPLHANTVLHLSEEEIVKNQLELESLVDAGVISITDAQGQCFIFHKDETYSVPAEDAETLPSLDALLAEEVAAEGVPPAPPPELPETPSVALDAEGLLPVDALGDLRVPDVIPEEPAAPPKLSVLPTPSGMDVPPEIPGEVQAASENDRFFSEVKKYVGARRGSKTKKDKA
jgi:hypothetical protein